MNQLNFTTTINAPAQKVWKVLWSDPTYRQWTAVFQEGSHAKSDWNEGSKIYFMDGKGQGMFSIIEKKIPEVQMTFKHMGEMKDGVETVSTWSGALESYYLSEENGVTTLRTEVDITDDFADYFTGTFPKALARIKEISENPVWLSIEATVAAGIDKVWSYWTSPGHITHWNFASDDWHCPSATVDLQPGGKFSSRMEAKDGSFGFDFGGVYDDIKQNEYINTSLGDGRKSNVVFSAAENGTKINGTFVAEETNTYELQQFGWQAILNNFKKYTEAN
jgi:uncharacterized protein YndB with AHSA1/START domain